MLEKIKTLFDYRLLPNLINQGADNHKNDKLIPNLYNLQIAIYNLDQYLETNWNIHTSDLEPYWHEINKILKQDFEVGSEEIPIHITEILTYQKHELNLRKGDLPTSLDPLYFYYYKSCDVKLLRKLIYKAYPQLKKKYELQDWKAFDLITELNDDVEDIFEDLESINGNAVLIKAQHSNIAVAEKYVSDVILLIEKLNKSQEKQIDPMITNATSQRINETKDLLSKVMQKLRLNPKLIEQSKLHNLLLMEI